MKKHTEQPVARLAESVAAFEAANGRLKAAAAELIRLPNPHGAPDRKDVWEMGRAREIMTV